MTQDEALKILKMGHSVFLTGEPGAGKTFVINKFVSYLREHGIDPAITASTGIASTHIGGMTIHSWSGVGIRATLSDNDLEYIKSNKNVSRRIKKAGILIIDEVSMLGPDLLNSVNLACKAVRGSHLPFGGLQIVLVGDFFQLPPINNKPSSSSDDSFFSQFADEYEVAQFAYQSSAWQQLNPKICYLSEQHRQEDSQFLAILSAIRNNSFNNDHLSILSATKLNQSQNSASSLRLFSHNANVDRVNDETLAKISGAQRDFMMTSRGPDMVTANLKKGCLSPEKLSLKIGASVMFTKNSPKDSFVNGTLGTVTGFDSESGLPIIKTKDGRSITAGPMDWSLDVDGYSIAKITQIPLRLAWAITVHKSQGMSLDEAVIDLSSVFEFGQGYVALSRVRSLNGLRLLGWNEQAFQVHPSILSQDAIFRDNSIDAEGELKMLSEDQISQIYNKNLERLGGTKPVSQTDSLNILIKEKGEKPDKIRKPAVIKQKTHDLTLAYWDKGMDINEIAQTRELSVDTIITHISKLRVEDKINKTDLEQKIFKISNLDNIMNILKYINSSGDIRLKSIFDHFEGKNSYNDIRLAFLLLD